MHFRSGVPPSAADYFGTRSHLGSGRSTASGSASCMALPTKRTAMKAAAMKKAMKAMKKGMKTKGIMKKVMKLELCNRQNAMHMAELERRVAELELDMRTLMRERELEARLALLA